MDYNKAALEMHESHHGKVGIVSKVEVKTRDDLSTAYTPGVAEPLPEDQGKPRRRVQVHLQRATWWPSYPTAPPCWVWATSAPEAGLPVMEGKGRAVQGVRRVDAFPICIDAHDAASVIAACKAIAPHLRRHQSGGHQEPGVLRDRGDLGAGAGHPRFPRRPARHRHRGDRRPHQCTAGGGQEDGGLHIVLNGPGARARPSSRC